MQGKGRKTKLRGRKIVRWSKKGDADKKNAKRQLGIWEIADVIQYKVIIERRYDRLNLITFHLRNQRNQNSEKVSKLLQFANFPIDLDRRVSNWGAVQAIIIFAI